MKIFDCVVINDELDLLEARLKWLDGQVDHVVLVEATRTFSGEAKPLHYATNAPRFAQWADRITHVVVHDLPFDPADRWPAEVMQRNALRRGLVDAMPSDVALIADIDEFPSHEALQEIRKGITGVVALQLPRTFRFANWLPPPPDTALRACKVRELTDPHYQRNHVRPARILRDAGIHLTCLLDPAGVRRKFASYAHAELDTDRSRTERFIELAYHYGVDIFSRRLARLQRETELTEVQRFVRAEHPEWFDFAPLPSLRERLMFKWYAEWRWRTHDEERVLRTDATYPRASFGPTARGLGYWGITRARYHGWRVKQRVRRLLGR